MSINARITFGAFALAAVLFFWIPGVGLILFGVALVSALAMFGSKKQVLRRRWNARHSSLKQLIVVTILFMAAGLAMIPFIDPVLGAITLLAGAAGLAVALLSRDRFLLRRIAG